MIDDRGGQIVRSVSGGTGQVPIDPSECLGGTELQEPSLLTKAKNLAVATTQHVRAGMPKATPEEAARRWAICQECPNLIGGKTCVLCGCGMEYKATWQEQPCKAGKW